MRYALMLAFLTMAPDAKAHLMSPGHGTLNLVNSKVYVVVSLPVSVFMKSAAAPAAADGVLTAHELNTFGTALRRCIRDRLLIHHNERSVQFSSLLLNLPQGDHHEPGRSRSVTVMGVAPIDGTSRSGPIEVTTKLWGIAANRLKLKATITQAGKTVRTEIFEFTPRADRHRFFATPRLK
ncbi:MAG: hypothetical protein VX589_04325 [Myxococcota bacterium]|nr:hypothetical protein [Myxococcota bacterium]